MTQRQMTGRVEGKVALSPAARGQGCSHAITLAREGADIIAVDIEGQVDSVPYRCLPRRHGRTVKEVEALTGESCTKADVRDFDALKQPLTTGSPSSAGWTCQR